MELAVSVDRPVLVQFTNPSAILTGGSLKVCGSTPRVSQAQMATRIKLAGSNRLTTWPSSRLFSRAMK